MRVLVAPDKFKGTLTAEQAARAIQAGWLRASPGDRVDTVPLADGGEGTMEALLAGLGGEVHQRQVTGPLGSRLQAPFAVVRGVKGDLGVVEMARASGLALVAPARRDPRRATTRGTGELILEACRLGLSEILVCIGGSATNDAGAGMAQAVGVRLLDRSGRDLPPGGAALLELARIDLGALDRSVRRARFVVASDVDNPLTGPYGASAAYGPQKGAGPEDVRLLDRALAHFAAVVHRDLGVDLRDVPGAGAAGGLGAGLMAFLGARLRPGVEVVMEAVGLRRRLEEADLLVTGEGRFDEQSLHGKAPLGAVHLASEMGVPALVLAGQATVGLPGTAMFTLAQRFGEREAVERPRELLEDLAAEVARLQRTEGAHGQGG